MLPIRDLRSRLGPEGRLIYDKMSLSGTEKLKYGISAQGSPELDYLFKQLIHPNASTNPEKILSYLAYYYPRIKNAANVQLLTQYFLQCPLFFNDGQVIELRWAVRTIDCFRYVVEKKYQVSEPTVPFYSFYRSIFAAVRNVLCSGPIFMNSWKVCPIIVGCLIAEASRDTHDPYPRYLEAIREADSKFLETFERCLVSSQSLWLGKDLIYLELICLSCVQDRVSERTLAQILKLSPDLPLDLVVFVFNSPYGFDNGRLITAKSTNSIAVSYLSGLSRLFCTLLSVYPDQIAAIKCVDSCLNHCRNYCVSLFDLVHATHPTLANTNSPTWKLLKQNFFALISMFEGVARFIYQQGTFKDAKSCCGFSRKMLDSLLYTSFISDAIGTGGFDAYTFVYNVSLDCLKNMDAHAAGLLVQTWAESPRPIDASAADFMARSKLLFWLNFSESCIGILPREIRFGTVLPIVRQLIENPVSQEVLEGSHSVVLGYFELLQDSNEASTSSWLQQTKKTVYEYLQIALKQFPSKLSFRQTSVVVDTVARAVSPGSALYDADKALCDEIFLLIFRECMHSSNEHFEEQKTAHFKHRQPALAAMLIQVTPLIPDAAYIGWMQKIKSSLVDPVVNNEEKQALLDKLWDSILVANKHFPDKGSAAIRWWYRGEEARL